VYNGETDVEKMDVDDCFCIQETRWPTENIAVTRSPQFYNDMTVVSVEFPAGRAYTTDREFLGPHCKIHGWPRKL